ncbi:MAG: protein kinase domain-containing protein [Rubrivivax sp.]
MNRPRTCHRFGTAEFDEARFELRVAGLPVEVEHRALQVLACLLRHAGEVVTKEELLSEVWAGRVTVDKVLTNAVAKLRRALGEANAQHIATQARVGYRLDGTVTRVDTGRAPPGPLALRVGDAVPGRTSFVLKRPLGPAAARPRDPDAAAMADALPAIEVWLAEHARTQEPRVYKFAVDPHRLRLLQREVTLLRVLQDSEADADRFVELIDWNFASAPFFIELRFGGESLDTWAAAHLGTLDLEGRVALAAQVAEAVAAAHALGVLHKDLKPANVLVSGSVQHPMVRLTDFGSGHLLAPDRLDALGITRLGLTVDDTAGSASTQGTLPYLAPELFVGQAPNVRSDVFALGVLTVQLLTGRLGQPMASGWEDDIDDPVLRDDLQRATAGDPQRRLASAAELADRLRRLDARREAARLADEERASAQRAQQALARAQARRPAVRALAALLVLGVATTAWLLREALEARDEARLELARTQALSRYLHEDLIGRANPLVSAKGPDTTLRELLLTARDRVPVRFATQPQIGASVHASLAASLAAVELLPEAEAEARQAIALLEGTGADSGKDAGAGARVTALQARAVLVRVLARRGDFPGAQAALDTLEQRSASLGEALTPGDRAHVAAARGALHAARNEFVQAAQHLRTAVDGLSATDPLQTAQRDLLRLDLVQALALAGRDAEARSEGAALIGEAERRPEDSALLIALARVSLARAQGEDHDVAQQLLLAAQPVIVQRLGADHPRHLRLLNELFAVAFRRADWPRALDHAREVHERIRARMGDAHVSTPVTLLNWGRALSEAGRPAEALEKVRPAHAQLERLLGANAPQAQDAAFVLALTLLDLGRTAEADAFVERLNARVLESGRATGVWQGGIDALRGMAAQQRGHAAQARVLLGSALQTLKDEATLAQPSRVFLSARRALAALGPPLAPASALKSAAP